MTRLKLFWKKTLPEADRDYWREQFASARTQAELRQELADKYGISLPHDTQLGRFRGWLQAEDLRELEAEAVRCDRAELEAQGLAGEPLRAELLRRMAERALARGDYKLGVAAVNLDLKAERLAIHQRRLQLDREQLNLQRANGKLQKEKDFREWIKRPEIREKFLPNRKKGITKKTIREIERDLNLR
jgi:hypothetical protein